jgi:divinyl chlorophyllide a 8-vinyl-reductase
VKESVLRGFTTIALVRNKARVESEEGQAHYGEYFKGAHVLECAVTNPSDVLRVLQNIQELYDGKVDTIVSCLAAPSGYRRDVYAIDYKATLNYLEAGRKVGARHFVLLSAFCVQKPLLHLQKAKLKFEAVLHEQTAMTWSIVRPTAFFKSISRQLDKGVAGKSYLAFGNGEITQCNPIAESDLATFMIDCIHDTKR